METWSEILKERRGETAERGGPEVRPLMTIRTYAKESGSHLEDQRDDLMRFALKQTLP